MVLGIQQGSTTYKITDMFPLLPTNLFNTCLALMHPFLSRLPYTAGVELHQELFVSI